MRRQKLDDLNAERGRLREEQATWTLTMKDVFDARMSFEQIFTEGSDAERKQLLRYTIDHFTVDAEKKR